MTCCVLCCFDHFPLDLLKYIRSERKRFYFLLHNFTFGSWNYYFMRHFSHFTSLVTFSPCYFALAIPIGRLRKPNHLHVEFIIGIFILFCSAQICIHNVFVSFAVNAAVVVAFFFVVLNALLFFSTTIFVYNLIVFFFF